MGKRASSSLPSFLEGEDGGVHDSRGRRARTGQSQREHEQVLSIYQPLLQELPTDDIILSQEQAYEA